MRTLRATAQRHALRHLNEAAGQVYVDSDSDGDGDDPDESISNVGGTLGDILANRRMSSRPRTETTAASPTFSPIVSQHAGSSREEISVVRSPRSDVTGVLTCGCV
jgi:hypothetical protein